MEEQLRALYNYAQELGAEEAHLEMGELFQDELATGVIAVYIGERPAHRVLADLIAWAEAHGEEVLLGILADMSRPGYVDPWGGDNDE